MSLFPPKFRHKVLQMTYRPSKGKSSFNPKKTIEDIEKAIDDGLESFFTEKDAGKDKDSEKEKE